MNAQDVLDNMLLQAISQVMNETETNPIQVGAHVGQLDLDKYGPEPAILTEITEDGFIVERAGQKTIWPVEGTINVDRVNVVYEEMLQYALEQMRGISMIADLLGTDFGADLNDSEDELADDEIGGANFPNFPTPGCDCPHCQTFTPEEHAEAAKIQAERNAATPPTTTIH